MCQSVTHSAQCFWVAHLKGIVRTCLKGSFLSLYFLFFQSNNFHIPSIKMKNNGSPLSRISSLTCPRHSVFNCTKPVWETRKCGYRRAPKMTLHYEQERAEMGRSMVCWRGVLPHDAADQCPARLFDRALGLDVFLYFSFLFLGWCCPTVKILTVVVFSIFSPILSCKTSDPHVLLFIFPFILILL